jgi:hypothetical protein|tara:strand:+ start:1950 stop:2780 length:831 start_codon:yes stop_codon:yes gene_type:complete
MSEDTVKETALATIDLNIQLPSAKPEYQSMLANIAEKAPAIAQASSNFYKSHSQMMSVTLDVTAITPIRSVKHSLAEIEKTKAALQEAYFSMKKDEVKLKKLERKLLGETDELEYELLEIKINEKQATAASSRGYVEAAVRKLNFFSNQYENLMKKIGKDELTEADYELEEVKYHIMTCMKQALNSARPRNGVIDEGNMIYLFDLGINAAQAQLEVMSYLNWEKAIIKDGQVPEHHHTVQWLEGCADKWAHCPRAFAESRGFDILDETSLTNTPVL